LIDDFIYIFPAPFSQGFLSLSFRARALLLPRFVLSLFLRVERERYIVGSQREFCVVTL
jgi:hypothetical protein